MPWVAMCLTFNVVGGVDGFQSWIALNKSCDSKFFWCPFSGMQPQHVGIASSRKVLSAMIGHSSVTHRSLVGHLSLTSANHWLALKITQ